MIFVTGDTHGLQNCDKLRAFAEEHPNLTKDDFVIIAGDFGAVWSAGTLDEKLKYYTKLPFTVLFVDGNHENFDLLNSYPVEMWHGGKVHKIKADVIHLMRGQVFEIDKKTIFTFGGATSLDKYMREDGISWWKQELPTFEELDEGIANLKRYNNEVDYIITHSCGERALMYPTLRHSATLTSIYPESQILSYIEDIAKFKRWYFGHFHIDADLGGRYRALMHDVIEIK